MPRPFRALCETGGKPQHPPQAQRRIILSKREALLNRTLLNRICSAAAFAFLLCSAAVAQMQNCAPVVAPNDFLGIKTIRLWPGDAPQATDKACQDTPALTIFEPQPGHANGSAVVVLPGGAYVGLAANLEGRQVADWFTARGFQDRKSVV